MDYSKCSHVGQVNDNIKGNTKGCEKCEKIWSRLGSFTSLSFMWSCMLL